MIQLDGEKRIGMVLSGLRKHTRDKVTIDATMGRNCESEMRNIPTIPLTPAASKLTDRLESGNGQPGQLTGPGVAR